MIPCPLKGMSRVILFLVVSGRWPEDEARQLQGEGTQDLPGRPGCG
jgi:hypothetical protein